MAALNGPTHAQHRGILQRIARRVMVEKGLMPDFPPPALSELARIGGPAPPGPGARDLRGLPWCSIDNDDSRDLDQLTAAEPLPGGKVRLLVAVADVDGLVANGSALDARARHNTATVYTPAQVFPLLPERLSTDLTSLNQGEDRLAVVAGMTLEGGGQPLAEEVFSAVVRNRVRLAYDPVAAWLQGEGPEPPDIADAPGLAENLRLQDRAAQGLRESRHRQGALTFEPVRGRAVFSDGSISALSPEPRNRARRLIEDLMIAANGVTARFLSRQGSPSLRRVVRAPRRWERIREVAAERGGKLPPSPDAPALEGFLVAARARDPDGFPDLSLTIIKLMGPGEYAVEAPGSRSPGHFGLAVKDYAHSTAPNRRFPDIVTQRLVKAAIARRPSPYGLDELAELARHCTEVEDAIKKVERHLEKSAAALFMEERVGDLFDSMVTGAAEKGTWVRLLGIPVEGKLVRGFAGADVGDRLRVRLAGTDVERGHIDFERA